MTRKISVELAFYRRLFHLSTEYFPCPIHGSSRLEIKSRDTDEDQRMDTLVAVSYYGLAKCAGGEADMKGGSVVRKV